MGAPVGSRVHGYTFDWKAIKDARDAYVHRLNGIYGTMLKNSGVTMLQGVSQRRHLEPS
jgi:glutathione reductase (NADPH)